ncbi:PLDc N-terminal domain-containing protein [Nocardioides daeguensis]|nr:PLDc N-terminal domain-containing protein [Nocardioides daeguensis]MCR1773563.1 PLDc N-terminal domain-containing protein [Nocardioides daeguensis]
MVSFWDILWLLVWSFFFVSYLMVLFNILGDLFRDHELSGGMKAVWVVFLLVLPAITAIVYLVARGKGMAGRAIAQAQRNEEAARAYIRDAAGRTPAEEIATAKSLLDAGTIGQDEFDLLKARALGVQ